MIYPDTIHSPAAFEENPPYGFDGVLHWAWLNAGVAHIRGITPTDFDATVTINHFSLMIEAKNLRVDISRGKEWQINDLLDQGTWVIMAVWGKECPVLARVRTFGQPWWDIRTFPGYGELDCSDACTKFARSWANHVNSLDRNAWRIRSNQAIARLKSHRDDGSTINPNWELELGQAT